MITPGKNKSSNEVFAAADRNTTDHENSELFQFDKTGNLSVRYLRESYNAAKARASELNTNAGLSGNLRSHCQQTIRVYSALATLLYSTISISKADDLERFVRKRSLQVPNSLFDIDEWKPVLQIARNVRMGESGKYLDELGAFKSFMKLRLERLLTGSRLVVHEYKQMKAETTKELEALKIHFDDFKYKVIPYLQQKVTKLENENYKHVRDNQVFRDAGIAKDVEIKELTRSKNAQEHEHASHVERVKKESFEAIAFAKSKIETQQSAHRAELSSLSRQHVAKIEDMQKSFDAQSLHNAVTNKEVIDRLTTEREWLQKTHATVLENADKVQQQFKAQCDNEVARLEKRYNEAVVSASSRQATEASNTAQLMQSSAATYEAKLSSANAAREYETNMLQVKLDAMESTLKDTQASLEKSQNNAETVAARQLAAEAELIAKRSEVDNIKEKFDAERLQHDALKQSTNSELERLRLQLDGLFNDKSAMTIEMGTLRAERDEVTATKETWNKELDTLAHKERTLRKEHEELVRVLAEMESEKCRLMSHYDEKCQQCDSQKKEIAAMKQDKEIVRQKHKVKEEENYQLMSDLEADKSRLMGYYDEKCLQSDGYKKRIQQKETHIVQMRKDFNRKEIEGMQLMNEMEADKSRLMGYYDEKCLQIGTYKKQLANFEKIIKQLQESGGGNGSQGDGGESQSAVKKELATFKKQMSDREMVPITTRNSAKKDAAETVAAVSRVIAEYTVMRCVNDVTTALRPSPPAARAATTDVDLEMSFVSAQYAVGSNEEDIQKIRELETLLSKKNNDIHALLSGSEAKQAETQAVISQLEVEVQSLKSQLLSADAAGDKASSEVNILKDKINELTKANYYSTEEVAKLTQELAEQEGKVVKSNSFAVGDKVVGNHNGNGEWFPGSISKCGDNGMYDIVYDDGDSEQGVDASRVKTRPEGSFPADGGIQLANTEKELQEVKDRLQRVEKELLEETSKLQNAEARAHSNELSAKVVAAELEENKTLVDKLNTNNRRNMEAKDASLASQESTIAQLRKLVSDLKGSKDELEDQLKEMKADPTLNAKIEKLQAITRGFNARARVKRTKMHRDAQTSGVLVATKHTAQGDSGWYCAPDGSLYYFVLDAEEWILTCGPITREAFEDTVLNLKPKKVSSAGYLKVSNFDLVTQTVDQPGDLYMSTSTWKLYFAVSVDHLVTENR